MKIKKLLLFSILFFSLPVFANPTGGNVVAGNATISQNGNILLINEFTNNAIINWKTFNIASFEKTAFLQPGSNAIILNRVLGNGASEIDGSLLANGNVFIVNPAGIIFGQGAQVNVGSLLATTADISNANFMKGNYSFAQTGSFSGAIINNGSLTTVRQGGLIALVAPGVENNGLIQANLGEVALGSGNAYTLDLYGDNLINFGVNSQLTHAGIDGNGNVLKDAVTNTGKIIANGGKVLLTVSAAQNVVDNSINMSGVVEAKTASQRNGVIVLSGGDNGIVNVSGQLDASGTGTKQTGGYVQVTGNQIQLVNNAKINASGTNGGGEVLIGGDNHGTNPNVKNSNATYVGENVNINADALQNGNGGKVIVWSNGNTGFCGTISARGGALSGNGGYVETSGKQGLGIANSSSVDALAPHGMAGDWLLDPTNINITSTGSTTPITIINFNTPGTTLNIAPAALDNAMSNVMLQANNDITFSSAVALRNNGVGITAEAGRDINVNASISTTNGNITLKANDSADVGQYGTPSSRGSGAGDITGGGALTAGAGNISLNVSPTATVQGVTFTAGSITLGNMSTTGNVTVNSGNAITQNTSTTINAGSVNLNASNGVTFGNITTSGSINISSGNAITQNAATTLNAGSVNFNAANGITLNGATNSSGVILFSANTDGTGNTGFTMGSGSSITTQGSSVTIDVNNSSGGTGAAVLRQIITNGGALTVATDFGDNTTGGSITQGSGTSLSVGDANFSTGNGAITLTSTANNFAGIVSLTTKAANTINITDANAITLGNCSTGTGGFTVTANGAGGGITQAAGTALTLGGNATFIAGANDITLNNTGNNFTNVGITSGNNVILRDLGALNFSTSTITGDLTVNTGGNIIQSGAVSVVNGTATFITPGDIILNTSTNNFNTVVLDADNVTLRDNSAIKLGTSDVAGNFTLTAAGAITQADLATLKIGGVTTLAAGSSNDIILDNEGNNLNTVGITSARDVTLRTDGALVFNTSTISRNLTVTTNGNITQNGALSVANGLSTFNTGSGSGNDITLNNSGNNFNTIAVSNADNVSLTDTSSITLNDFTVHGNLGVNADDSMTIAGVLNVNDAVSLNANVDGSGANSFVMNAGSSIAAGGNVDLAVNTSTGGNGSITFGNISCGGVVTMTNNTAGAITQNAGTTLADNGGGINITSANGLTLNGITQTTAGGAINLNVNNDHSGASGFVMGAGSLIQALNTAANTIINVNTAQGGTGTAVLRDINTNGGALTVDTNGSGGSITQIAGTSLITGAANFSAGSNGSITLTNLTNNFGGAVSLTTHGSNNASIASNNSITLGACNLSQNLTLTANGIDQTGALDVAGSTTLIAGNGNIVLNNLGNNFGNIKIASANNADIYDSSALNFTLANVTGNLVATSAANISQSGALLVGGTLTTNSNGGTILNNSGNRINGFNATNIGSGNIELTDISDSLAISGINQESGGDVLISNTGNINTLGAINGDGNITLTATDGTLTIGSAITGSGLGIITLNGDDGINLNADVDSGLGNQVYNDAITLGGDVKLTGNDITFNSTINGDHNLTLDAGSSGNITFNGDVGNISRLNFLEILNANDFTNNATINVNNFAQLAGTGTTYLGAHTLNVLYAAYFATNILSGSINTKYLILNTNFANLLGSINGLTGELALRLIYNLNPHGVIYFNGAELSNSPTSPATNATSTVTQPIIVEREKILPYYLISAWKKYYYQVLLHKPWRVWVR